MNADAPTGFGFLSLIVFLPALAAALLLFVPSEFGKTIKAVGLGATIATLCLSISLVIQFQPNTYHFQFVELVPWIESLGINYRMGVDGISLWLVFFTNLISVVSMAFALYEHRRVKNHTALLLLLQTAMLGAFCSLDLVVFYTFFELSLIPAYLLIAIWGGPQRHRAGIKFLVYTFAASAFMLVGMIWLAMIYRQATGVTTFSIAHLQSAVAQGRIWTGAFQAQALIFWSFAVAFLVKSPVFPFHTWQAGAYSEGPISGTILVASMMSKLGPYGLLRLCLPLFPDAVRANGALLMILAVISILYGGIVAAVQTDLRRMLAYSSLAHMGFVTLGIVSLQQNGIVGGAYQQINHAVITAALFLLAGFLLQRRGTTKFSAFGGLKAQMPVFAALFLIAILASAGLPGTNGFVGEFLSLLGAFESSIQQQFGLNVWLAVFAGLGVVIAAVYLLILFQRLFYGPVTHATNLRLRDLKPWETAVAGLLTLLILWGGLMPNTFLFPMEPSVQAIRKMAVDPPTMRPDWLESSMEVDRKGQLMAGGNAIGMPASGEALGREED